MKTQTLGLRITWRRTLAERLRSACAARLLPLLLLLALPAMVQAQFNYNTTTNGTITITGYFGPGGAVTVPDRIPDTTNGLPVTSIDGYLDVYNGDWLGAFENCASLISVTIPASVTFIGSYAFVDCMSLTSVCFLGDAPQLSWKGVFYYLNWNGVGVFDPATIYYLPGTTGWSTNSSGLPTALWTPQVQTSSASLGVRTNQFGFTINWASGMSVAVDASISLVNPIWTPLATNTLTSGSLYFSDPQWTNYPARFYRLRWPQ